MNNTGRALTKVKSKSKPAPAPKQAAPPSTPAREAAPLRVPGSTPPPLPLRPDGPAASGEKAQKIPDPTQPPLHDQRAECVACSAALKPDRKFCGKCGNPV